VVVAVVPPDARKAETCIPVFFGDLELAFFLLAGLTVGVGLFPVIERRLFANKLSILEENRA
jgi:hypothetical protein